ncbi:amino acid ABC transporter permease [Roseibium suaedae]|uniref:General L-amino acid transport system permease protein n=1 Tax=Roseibium suaedae TaxID=735517 RepID=A0A1M7PDI2_9HYPH|nr:amino acid ABC transporter permease [Roseibium suaedae]SHN14978.1 general L-amino acid transport system permease protein [Roseibium suaedae]
MTTRDKGVAQPEARSSLINDPQVRAVFFQVLLVAVVAFVGYVIVSNTIANLQRQNIASGYGFLSNIAGFGISLTLIDYAETSSYGTAILVGLLNTILVAVVGIVCASTLGFLIGVARLSKNWVISRLAYCYVEAIRNVPLLLQIVFWYFLLLNAVPNARNSLEFGGSLFLNNRGFFLPKPVFGDGAELAFWGLILSVVASIAVKVWAKKRQMSTGQQFPVGLTALGLIVLVPLLCLAVAGFPVTFDYPALKGFNFTGGQRVIPELIALVTALSIYTSAFIAEIVRAGIQAVSHGQTEAAHALGLRHGPTLRLVIIPQAMRVIIPPLTSQYLNLTKNSSLAVAIAFPDLVSLGGTVLNQTGQAIEVISIWMLVYLSLSLITSAFMNWYNQKMALVER